MLGACHARPGSDIQHARTLLSHLPNAVQTYTRQVRDDSSGFEHVFVGESDVSPALVFKPPSCLPHEHQTHTRWSPAMSGPGQPLVSPAGRQDQGVPQLDPVQQPGEEGAGGLQGLHLPARAHVSAGLAAPAVDMRKVPAALSARLGPAMPWC